MEDYSELFIKPGWYSLVGPEQIYGLFFDSAKELLECLDIIAPLGYDWALDRVIFISDDPKKMIERQLDSLEQLANISSVCLGLSFTSFSSASLMLAELGLIEHYNCGYREQIHYQEFWVYCEKVFMEESVFEDIRDKWQQVFWDSGIQSAFRAFENGVPIEDIIR